MEPRTDPKRQPYSWESGNLNSGPDLAVNSLCSGNTTDTFWAFLSSLFSSSL